MSMTEMSLDELEAGLPFILGSPKDRGIIAMIVRRPASEEREVLAAAELSLEEGLVGDAWCSQPSRTMNYRCPNPDMQLNLMNSRVIELVAQSRDRWPLAGDQFFVDLDLSAENLPPCTQLSLGTAIIEITPQPHTACHKFKARYGAVAHKFVNASKRKDLQFRGVCAKVIRAGTIHEGDVILKV